MGFCLSSGFFITDEEQLKVSRNAAFSISGLNPFSISAIRDLITTQEPHSSHDLSLNTPLLSLLCESPIINIFEGWLLCLHHRGSIAYVWEAINFKRGEEVMDVDMLLLDVKATLLQATVNASRKFLYTQLQYFKKMIDDEDEKVRGFALDATVPLRDWLRSSQ
ncbi:hypothetical protein Bca4012_066710 [Brassica carinata]